jgi:hypothetical protein
MKCALILCSILSSEAYDLLLKESLLSLKPTDTVLFMGGIYTHA